MRPAYLLFPFERPLHQPPDGFLGRSSGMQHLVHLAGNGHLDRIALGQIHRCIRRFQSFGRPAHASTRSPKPASPARVCGRPPMATANRVISAKPRVISAAMALFPSPIPCNTPAPMATTFLIEPPISTPIGSELV